MSNIYAQGGLPWLPECRDKYFLRNGGCMFNFNLTCRFREQLEYAVSQWKCGEEENMFDLLRLVQSEAFADGCRYMREQVEEILNIEREAGYYEK